MHYLKNLPIDRLKIDRSFVNEVLVDSKNAAIVSTIASMAHHLKLKVTAEGVENEEQLHFCRHKIVMRVRGITLVAPFRQKSLKNCFYVNL